MQICPRKSTRGRKPIFKASMLEDIAAQAKINAVNAASQKNKYKSQKDNDKSKSHENIIFLLVEIIEGQVVSLY